MVEQVKEVVEQVKEVVEQVKEVEVVDELLGILQEGLKGEDTMEAVKIERL